MCVCAAKESTDTTPRSGRERAGGESDVFFCVCDDGRWMDGKEGERERTRGPGGSTSQPAAAPEKKKKKKKKKKERAALPTPQ